MEDFKSIIAAFFFILIATWLMVWSMVSRGIATPNNFAWYLISNTRWVFTGIGVMGLLIWCIPEIIKIYQKITQLRKDSFERLIESEVRRRLEIYRFDDRKNLEKEREQRKRIDAVDREGLERIWREEFKQKYEIMLKQARSATDAVENAFNEFI